MMTRRSDRRSFVGCPVPQRGFATLAVIGVMAVILGILVQAVGSGSLDIRSRAAGQSCSSKCKPITKDKEREDCQRACSRGDMTKLPGAKPTSKPVSAATPKTKEPTGKSGGPTPKPGSSKAPSGSASACDASGGFWLNNSCHQPGKVIQPGYVVCGANDRYHYTHIEKGESCPDSARQVASAPTVRPGQAGTAAQPTVKAPTEKGTCERQGGIWVNSRCYLQGQILQPGYIACGANQRYAYPHIEKGEVCPGETPKPTPKPTKAAESCSECLVRTGSAALCPSCGGAASPRPSLTAAVSSCDALCAYYGQTSQQCMGCRRALSPTPSLRVSPSISPRVSFGLSPSPTIRGTPFPTFPPAIATGCYSACAANASSTQCRSCYYNQADGQWQGYTVSGGCRKERTTSLAAVGCGPTTTANILTHAGKPTTPVQVAEELDKTGRISCNGSAAEDNVEILKRNGFTADNFDTSSQSISDLSKYIGQEDVVWIGAQVNDIGHHTYIQGYSKENGQTVYNLHDPWYGDSKCTAAGRVTLNCTNANGKDITVDLSGTTNGKADVIILSI